MMTESKQKFQGLQNILYLRQIWISILNLLFKYKISIETLILFKFLKLSVFLRFENVFYLHVGVIIKTNNFLSPSSNLLFCNSYERYKKIARLAWHNIQNSGKLLL